MGEEKEKIKVEKKKNEAGKKSAGGGKNDAGVGIATILLKLDLHCEGCAQKVRRSVRHFEGVEDVKADASSGKLTVKGNVDPLWLREKVESKTKKKVALLSAQPKKVAVGGTTGAGGEKKSDEKVENKAVEEKKKSDEKVENKVAEEKKGEDKKPKKVQCNTEVVQLHCDGSARKVKQFLIKELKRKVAVVAPKKGDGSGSGCDNKKNKEIARGGGRGSGGDGKKKDGASSSRMASKSTEPKEQKTEVMNNKKECDYGGNGYSNPNMYYTMPPSIYNQNHVNQDYGATMQDHHGYYGHSTGYMPAPPYLTASRDHGYGYRTGYMPPPPYLTASRDHGYGYRTGYVSPPHFTAPRDHDHDHSGYVPPPYSAPQYFSDENPNACSVM
ncbi:heavy metal-associated isoprenylated plant protein 3-like [Solanum verrucosum]|uniref:heavy metal-associated isoprenylated plant protein 3-like n=1 Tax=Solanum verrucosum TaxID=315347 RepID=UPI0020D04482|nr:heavy metal-associated isoprenylated plant protein 3-like [Solanum verrucosum]